VVVRLERCVVRMVTLQVAWSGGIVELVGGHGHGSSVLGLGYGITAVAAWVEGEQEARLERED
jgi:hypothetical protein